MERNPFKIWAAEIGRILLEGDLGWIGLGPNMRKSVYNIFCVFTGGSENRLNFKRMSL